MPAKAYKIFIHFSVSVLDCFGPEMRLLWRITGIFMKLFNKCNEK